MSGCQATSPSLPLSIWLSPFYTSSELSTSVLSQKSSMASNSLKSSVTHFPQTSYLSPPKSLAYIGQLYHHPRLNLRFSSQSVFNNPKLYPQAIVRSSLSSSSPSPPTSREEAILQAKTCLSATLEKPLNNPKLAGKLRKQKQPRFRVEIPVIDDSPESLSQLALDVFGGIRIRRKGSVVRIVIAWPNSALRQAAINAFEGRSSVPVDHSDISVIETSSRVLNSADVVVFLAPEASVLTAIEAVTDSLSPKPVVLFNPNWAFEEEENLGDQCKFVNSFEVIYSFMGLEVKGLLSKKKGVVFKCVRDGVLSGEKWNVLVEEDGGELKVITGFKTRPSIGEVENVLYNLVAANSPITKSAKFLKDLVSNVTGKR